MNALALPCIMFLQTILGFISIPFGTVYADTPRSLDVIISQIQKNHYLPSPQILFIGDPEYATPTVSALYIQEADFFNKMLEEQKKRQDFYGLVIIQGGANYPTRLSQLMTWGNTLLKQGGWLILWNPKEDRFEAAFKKE